MRSFLLTFAVTPEHGHDARSSANTPVFAERNKNPAESLIAPHCASTVAGIPANT